MQTKFFNILLAFTVVLLMASCKKDEKKIDTSLLPGIWQISGTEQYLHFHDDGTGAFWDESEDVYEDDIEVDGNGWFNWAVAEETSNSKTIVKVALNFKIAVSGGSVPKNATITQLDASSMTWQDAFKNQTYFTRKKEPETQQSQTP